MKSEMSMIPPSATRCQREDGATLFCSAHCSSEWVGVVISGVLDINVFSSPYGLLFKTIACIDKRLHLKGLFALIACMVADQCCLPLNTTPVVMKALESEDEGVCGARVVGNGCDVPRPASYRERLTRPTAVLANAAVSAGLWPISGALPAPATRQAPRLPCSSSRRADL